MEDTKNLKILNQNWVKTLQSGGVNTINFSYCPAKDKNAHCPIFLLFNLNF